MPQKKPNKYSRLIKIMKTSENKDIKGNLEIIRTEEMETAS